MPLAVALPDCKFTFDIVFHLLKLIPDSTCLGSSFGNCCSAAGWCGTVSQLPPMHDGLMLTLCFRPLITAELAARLATETAAPTS